MTEKSWLALIIVGVVALASYLALTKPDDVEPYGSLEDDWWG